MSWNSILQSISSSSFWTKVNLYGLQFFKYVKNVISTYLFCTGMRILLKVNIQFPVFWEFWYWPAFANQIFFVAEPTMRAKRPNIIINLCYSIAGKHLIFFDFFHLFYFFVFFSWIKKRKEERMCGEELTRLRNLDDKVRVSPFSATIDEFDGGI